jgi:hypothetical protein
MLLAADTRPSFLTERGDAYTPGVGSGRPVECCCRRTFKGGSRDCLFMLFAAGSLLPRPDRMAYMIEDGTRLFDAVAHDFVAVATAGRTSAMRARTSCASRPSSCGTVASSPPKSSRPSSSTGRTSWAGKNAFCLCPS